MNKKVIVYVFMTALCFGTLEISGKIAGNNLDTFQFTFWRFIIGATILLPIVIGEQRERRAQLEERRAQRRTAESPVAATATEAVESPVAADAATEAVESPVAATATEAVESPVAATGYAEKVTLKDVLLVVIAGIICVPLSMGVAQAGIVRTNAATAAVILGTNGMFSMVCAHFLANERMTKNKVWYLVISLFGLLFMICPWNLQPGNTLSGSLMVLFGAMVFGLYTVIGKFAGKRIGSITQAAFSMYAGAFFLLIYVLISGRPVFDGLMDNVAVIVYAGIVVTGGGYLFMFLTIKNAGVQVSAISFFLKIAIAPLLSVIVLGESLTWNCFLGIGLVLLSSFLNLRANSRPKPMSGK